MQGLAGKFLIASLMGIFYAGGICINGSSLNASASSSETVVILESSFKSWVRDFSYTCCLMSLLRLFYRVGLQRKERQT